MGDEIAREGSSVGTLAMACLCWMYFLLRNTPDHYFWAEKGSDTVLKIGAFSKACVSTGPADKELGFAWHISLWNMKMMMMQYQNLSKLLPHVVEKKPSLDSTQYMILDAIP